MVRTGRSRGVSWMKSDLKGMIEVLDETLDIQKHL